MLHVYQRRSYLLVMVLSLFSLTSLSAKVITVTSTADSGRGTLRMAVTDAVDGDEIVFEARLNGAPTVLKSQITVDKNITITGNGFYQTRISGGNAVRVFAVASGVSVIFQDIAFVNGYTTTVGGGLYIPAGGWVTLNRVSVDNCRSVGDMATQGGGGIGNEGSLEMYGSRLKANTALGTSGSGGGILNLPGASLIMENCEVVSNEANRAGGGIEDASGASTLVTITNPWIHKNTVFDAPGNGGGIHIGGDGSLTVTGGRVLQNTAGAEGGGIWNNTGVLTVSGTEIAMNTALGDDADQGGGGLYNNGGGTIRVMDGARIIRNKATGASGSGGGILNNTGASLYVTSSTVDRNEANRAGGGIEDASGSGSEFVVTNGRIARNIVYNAPGNGGGIHVGGDGDVTITGSVIDLNEAGAEGGGVWIGSGTLNIGSTLVRKNVAKGDDADQGGGGLYNNGGGTIIVSNNTKVLENRATGASGSGGGILNNTGATLTITDSWINGNTANRAGGGIEDASGSGSMFTITNSKLEFNEVFNAPGNGGAIHIGGDGDLTVSGGTIRANKAGAEGGGIWNNLGTLTLMDRARVASNIAAGNDADQGGGGLYNNGGGTIRISGRSTVDKNMATGTSGSGGGILNGVGASLYVINSRVGYNEANRAGGGIEDISGADSEFEITDAEIIFNVVNNSPGNGGGVHIGGDGNLTVSTSTVSDNMAGAEGGGIWNNLGTLVVSDSEITRNIASGDDADMGGGGLYNNGGGTITVMDGTQITYNKATGTAGSGGGILNGIGATLTIDDSYIAYNQANRAGGGIEDISGAMTPFTVDNSQIDFNRVNYAPGNGAGVHVGGDGNLTITGGTVNENCAGAEGGGVWIGSGMLSITDTEISTNIAGGNDADQGGGGLYSNGGGTIELMNVRVVKNRAFGASGSGGGILNNVGATLLITNSQINDNEANRAGGGIEDASGSGSMFKITDSYVNNNVVNRAPGNGGGIHIGSDGDLMVSGGEVNYNRAGAEGGGIWNGMGTLTLTDVMISYNTAAGDDADQGGGGLYNNGGGTILLTGGVTVMGNKATGLAGSGGGILNNVDATLTINDAVISDNEANRAGGGIEDASGSASMVEITDTDILDNRVNFAPGNGGGVHVGSDGSLTIRGGNVSRNSAGQEGGGLWNNTATMEVYDVVLEDNVAEGNDADDGGGALFNNGGTMIVNGATVNNNSATGTSGSGGGLFSTAGMVTVDNSSFSGNRANRAGGAVEIVDGSYTSTDVMYDMNDGGSNPGNGGAFHVSGMMSTVDFFGGSVTNNVAANEGGGIWNQSGSMMSIMTVSILNNRVTDMGSKTTRVGGGGVFNNGGILDIEASTIAGNQLTGGVLTAGGGIANNTGGTITVMRSTVSGNYAGGGGGVANDGSAEITNTTITNNSALAGGGYAQATQNASLVITGTIVSDNMADLAPDFGTLFGSVTSGGYNLIGMDYFDQFPAVETDKEGMSAMLMPLADNGGMTMTHMPECTSPVINMGNPDDSSMDQIGQSVFGGTRDIGSFERQSSCGGYDAALTQPGSTTEQGDVSIYPNPVVGNFLNLTVPARFSGDVTLRIVSSDGRVRHAGTIQSTSQRLDVSGFAPGAYTLQVINGEERQSLRFVIAR